MSTAESDLSLHRASTALPHKLPLLIPAAAALAYPHLLRGFHLAVSPADAPVSALAWGLAAICLLAAFAVPVIGLISAIRLSRAGAPSSPLRSRARRLAYLSIGAPPLFVLTGVGLGLARIPLSDTLVWTVVWLAVAAYVFSASARPIPISIPATTRSGARLRVAHGVCAALIACYVLFHLANHLLGWWGPDAHAAMMQAGRRVYRSSWGEPILVALLLFQVFSGARLAWRASLGPADAYRVFQIGSGAYLAAFVLTHMNSALVSARAVHGIATDWAWASGAPDGLIHDAWNIRLVPHYAIGVFCILAHLCSGLRQVVLAHGVDRALANRIWVAGLIASALISAAIMAGLCGARF